MSEDGVMGPTMTPTSHSDIGICQTDERLLNEALAADNAIYLAFCYAVTDTVMAILLLL